MMHTLLAPLEEMEEYAQLKVAIRNNDTPVAVTGTVEAQKCHMIYGMESFSDVRLIVTYDEIRAKEIVEDYRMYDRDVMYYPAKDLIFYSADIHGQAIAQERLKVIGALTQSRPLTIVTTIDAGMDACVPYDKYVKNRITISTGDILDLDSLRRQLADMGYEYADPVERPGEYSVRGEIIDIFPLAEESPCRIDLWDDEVDTIHSIDVESQRSVESLTEVVIGPATEVFMTEDEMLAGIHRIRLDEEHTKKELLSQGKNDAATRLSQNIENFEATLKAYHGMVNLESYILYFEKEVSSFFDYFTRRDAVVILDEPSRCIERAEAVEYEFMESMSHRLEKGYILPKQMEVLHPLANVLTRLKRYPIVMMSALDMPIQDLPAKRKFFFQVRQAPSYNNDFSLLTKDILQLKEKKYKILFVSASETKGRRLCKDLSEYDIVASYDGAMDRKLEDGEVMVTKGYIRRGFEYPSLRFVVLTESDIFGSRKKKKKRTNKQKDNNAIHSFQDLKVGDYVVHENHGLGIYQGIEKIEVDQVIKDYLKVAYAGGSNLYVPATSLDVLQKYADKDSNPPKLNRLDSPEWKKTKSRVKGEVKEIAHELVDLYAKRQMKEGHRFEEDTVWQKEFEELFPYEETYDQIKAIEATKADMESTKMMDRLICGDVGYGKTEVAIRAAFKAVMGGKQVAFLVPTTILAVQHYNTFSQRMHDYGINVELLCRLRTAREQKKTIEGLRKGSVDVVVGTHRLLGKDISYKDLGLLIVDEEQRFGVTHKEKLKKIKNDIDVLTLTATPIPRTLHMSLIGIRDMSILEEPPIDRMPIQTFVMEKNEEIVREAILREVGRGGQVYYVYNRVDNMERVAHEISVQVPEAVVAYAHGQMNEHELEQTMFRFVEGEIDVLVATTIVETGLDIPNVNTIVIEDADRLGLSQLYQLRGRVGRSNRTAYAFMMYKRDKMLKEEAEKRLAAIKEFTDLGSGFRISMRDLEIRGAGNILGARQHGHMQAVGYDLYCKMLNEAILKLKGEKVIEDEYDTSIELKVDAFIPVSYIKNEFQKLDVYKRIAEVETEDEKLDMIDELVDRFGEPPKSVINLLTIALLKAKAHKAYITEIECRAGGIRFVMYPRAKVDPAKIPALIDRMGRRLKFVPETRPYFQYQPDGELLAEAESIVDMIAGLCEEEERKGSGE